MAEPLTAPMSIESKLPISLAKETIEQFKLTDLLPLLHTVEAQTTKRELNLGVFGRFNAGKSSFLNHLLGRALLPVGVVPVTSVVTEISYAADESASVIFQKGHWAQGISLSEIGRYTSEGENPGNQKGIELVRVGLPSLASFRSLRLVDTPGLEGLLTQSAEASLSWSPNVDLALVAVAVDPPLTQQDVALMERLHRFTPNVSILLTKMDTLDAAGQREVLRFVQAQLSARFTGGLRVFPFSTRPGYEHFREQFEREYLSRAVLSFHEERNAALLRKLETLLHSVADYLQLAMKSAEALEGDREKLRSQVLGSEDALADQKLQFKLLANHAAARIRPFIEHHLQKTALPQLQQALMGRFAAGFSQWQGSFARTLSQFAAWLREELLHELSAISAAECDTFQEPLHDFERQCQRNLQVFREQLSQKTFRAFGVPLRTTEVAIELQPPRAPDISIGKIFDHDWELLSPLIPMALVRRAVARRFLEKIESEVFKNFSRITSQWEEALRAAIHATEKEVLRRFDELLFTVRSVLSVPDTEPKSMLLSYLQKLQTALDRLAVPPQDSA